MIDKDQRSFAELILRFLPNISSVQCDKQSDPRLLQVYHLNGEKATFIFGGRYGIRLQWKGKTSAKAPTGEHKACVPKDLINANDVFGMLTGVDNYPIPEQGVNTKALHAITVHPEEGNTLSVFAGQMDADHLVTCKRDMFFVRGITYAEDPADIANHVWKNSVVHLPNVVFYMNPELLAVIDTLLDWDKDCKYDFRFNITTIMDGRSAAFHIFSERLKASVHIIVSLPFGNKKDKAGELNIGKGKRTNGREGVLFMNLEDFAKLAGGGIQKPVSEEAVGDKAVGDKAVGEQTQTKGVPPFATPAAATTDTAALPAENTVPQCEDKDASIQECVDAAPVKTSAVEQSTPVLPAAEPTVPGDTTTAAPAEVVPKAEDKYKAMDALELIFAYEEIKAQVQTLERESQKILRQLKARCKQDKKLQRDVDTEELNRVKAQLTEVTIENKKLKDENKTFRSAVTSINKLLGGSTSE